MPFLPPRGPHAAQAVIGIGGGSAMDVAKIVAVLLNNDVSLRDLLNKAADRPARACRR